MSSKKCPNCGLINAESAMRCDCGYDFTSGQMKGSYLSKKEYSAVRERAARKYALWGVLLGIAIPVIISTASVLLGFGGGITDTMGSLIIPIIIVSGVIGYFYGRSKG
jgi:hypothetical protein